MSDWDAVIIGGGPAGLTAGLYLCRGNWRTLLLEKETVGGYIMNVEYIENYPGFSEGVVGSQLGTDMKNQALKYGLKTERRHSIMKKKIFVVTGVLFLATVFLTVGGYTFAISAPAKPIEIKVAFGDSSASVFYHSVLVPWGKELEAASTGRLKVTHFHSGSLGPANEHWDLAVKGLADVSWQITLLSTGVFPLTDAVTLPPTGIHSAEKMNAILWELYQKNKYFKKEYQDAKVLFFAGGPPQWYWADKPIKAMQDIKGLRIGSTGGPAIEAIKLHGGTPSFFLPMDMYLALEKGMRLLL